jgi:hypothetical protein
MLCPGRGAAFFMPLRRAGTVPSTGVRYAPSRRPRVTQGALASDNIKQLTGPSCSQGKLVDFFSQSGYRFLAIAMKSLIQ